LFKDNNRKKVELFYDKLVSKNLFSSLESIELIINLLKDGKLEIKEVSDIQKTLWEREFRENIDNIDKCFDTGYEKYKIKCNSSIVGLWNITIQIALNQETEVLTNQINNTLSLLCFNQKKSKQ
jgi:hypothetical protein